MAKRKDLLLKESTISRMMGLAGIGALTNPFLREEKYPEGFRYPQDQEEELDEHVFDDEGQEVDLDRDDFRDDFEHSSDEECPDCGMPADECECDHDHDEDDEDDQDEESYDEGDEENQDQEEESGYMQENVRRSMKRLKKLLEQAEAGAEPPAPGGKDVPPPEPAPGGEGGDVEEKIKDFVKKLGELVQETLGVEVTVEEGEGEPEVPEGGELPPPPEGGAGAPPPAPMAEAINRLVSKVARRVKARLMEAKKETEMRMKHRAVAKKVAEKEKNKVGEKAKLVKEKQAAAKKKEMEMKKKKAAALKAKKK